MSDVRKGDYLLSIGEHTSIVFKGGKQLGHYWPDVYGGYAAFLTGHCKPVARPKTVRGCVLKLTNGEWDGTGEE